MHLQASKVFIESVKIIFAFPRLHALVLKFNCIYFIEFYDVDIDIHFFKDLVHESSLRLDRKVCSIFTPV
jgi:hypothetical protein